MLDFNYIDDWAPKFDLALCSHVLPSVAKSPRLEKPKYVSDARDLLFSRANRDALIDGVLRLICSDEIAGYHGSRLTEAEVNSIRSRGLIPLKPEDRHPRLTRALSRHPKWPEIAHRLDDSIRAHGGREGAGGWREGQVCLTLSRTGLTEGFNHYLTHGAEFDQCVAYALLGEEGVELLASEGSPRVIRVAVPGETALAAAHRSFSIDAIRSRGDLPNLVKEFLDAWSYRLAHPDFQTRTQYHDCGMIFHFALPPDWIVDISDHS